LAQLDPDGLSNTIRTLAYLRIPFSIDVFQFSPGTEGPAEGDTTIEVQARTAKDIRDVLDFADERGLTAQMSENRGSIRIL
jgi:hypothetical protein